jgi:uncharacterized protein YbjQ (UPF0145 family)
LDITPALQAAIAQEQNRMIDAKLITTAQEIPGYRVTRNLGVVRGIIVRSRSIVGNIGASLQTLFGGNITIYTELCEKARDDAHRLMVDHAGQLGANAIIGVRYDATEISDGVTEVLAYGTAVYADVFRG